ncbi:MAG TPA: hypothetical protein VK912_19525 [Longimicrobiales bacterium]|nr:hypothetical protein [Longimicrobiales bacterium]
MRHLFSVLMAGLVLAGCGDSAGPSDVIPPELAGSWLAAPACLPECGFTLMRISNPADSVNFVSGLQQTFRVTLTTSGRFNLTGLGGASSIRGFAEAVGSMLILRDEAGTQDTADYTLQGEYLGLTFRGVAEQFDFDGDGVGDPAMVRARFRRED